MLDTLVMFTHGHLDMLDMLNILDMLTQDHLDMLDSPERVVPDRIEHIGHTLEFLPEDNTVIR